MRIILSFIACAFLILSCKQKDQKKEENIRESLANLGADTTLVTNTTWGLISATVDIDGLKAMYDPVNIKDERICGAECVDSVDVTIVYPGSKLEFIVYWQDSLYHKQIAMIRCYTENAPYHTPEGIKIGTTLEELLKLNGKPVAFLGFDWDYGGGIISMNKGALENSKVHFNLDLSENPAGDNAVYGDTELNSDMPAVKKLQDKIRVSELFLSFNSGE